MAQQELERWEWKVETRIMRWKGKLSLIEHINFAPKMLFRIWLNFDADSPHYSFDYTNYGFGKLWFRLCLSVTKTSRKLQIRRRQWAWARDDHWKRGEVTYGKWHRVDWED